MFPGHTLFLFTEYNSRIKQSLEAVKNDLIGRFGYPDMTVEDFYDNVHKFRDTYTLLLCFFV